MSGLRDRAVDYFVAPKPSADTARRVGGASRAALEPPAAGVLGAHDDVGSVAALLASELRLRMRAGCVLLGEWSAEERPENHAAVASRPARRLADRLGGRGLDANAQGRLARVRLPGDPPAAGSAWRHALAAAECPSVWALAGPRPADFDPLLAELDLIVLVPGAVASAEMGRLALAGLAGSRAIVALSSRPVSSGLARMFAASSIATSRLLGADVIQAVRALA